MTAVNLGGLHMMRGMAMHDSDALIDQLMNKAGLLGADAVVPIASPVDRRYDHIALAAESMHLARDVARSLLRSVFQKIDAWPVRGRGPFPWNATRRRAIREDEHAAFAGHVKHRRCSSLCGVASRARVGDARCVERAQCLGQTVVAPVEDMIVREAAAVDARRGDAVDVAWMHAVVDLLVAPVALARSDACL